MEDIKVGQFVRDNEFGRIGKIIATENDMFMFECSDGTGIGYFSLKNDYKFSQNIIDLIEIGDYVNGYKVKDIRLWRLRFNGKHDYKLDFGELGTMTSEQIKSVVTKEQFDRMKYIVGGRKE